MLWYGCLVPRELFNVDELREFLQENWNYLNLVTLECKCAARSCPASC
jgi:hypothetical protein